MQQTARAVVSTPAVQGSAQLWILYCEFAFVLRLHAFYEVKKRTVAVALHLTARSAQGFKSKNQRLTSLCI